MGNWRIDIMGIGPNRNNNADCDVDLIVQEFLERLEKAGHMMNAGALIFHDERRLLVPTTGGDPVDPKHVECRCGSTGFPGIHEYDGKPICPDCKAKLGV